MSELNEQLRGTLALADRTLSPMQMIQVAFEKAIEQGAAMEVVGVILQEQNKMIERQDRMAYNESLERIQSKLKVVIKDKAIPGKGMYATSKAVDKAILEHCKDEGMILSFNSEDSGSADLLRLVCDVTLGAYTKRYTLPLPLDGAGAKGGGVMNRTDAACAAVTKGKRYLKNMIFNLRIEESDDEAGMPVQIYAPLMEAIENAATAGAVGGAYLAAVKAAAAINDTSAIKSFEKAANKRKQELSK